MINFLLFLLFHSSSASNLTQIPEAYINLASGNPLWLALIKNCSKPTMSCIQENIYGYLQETFDQKDDIQLAPFLKFSKNNLGYEGSDELENIGEGRSGLEDMSRSLHGKSVHFLMNHDVEVQLPETFFQGGTLKISPRSLEENGALLKIDILPKQQLAEGRIFKKIKKFISEKLIYALMAILLIIKLLAAKFMFLMPMMVGAVTAKKLLVKVLLFLFPALHHLFKFCAYVPHGTKYHHHKHHIQHVHHVAHKPHYHKHHGLEIIHPHADGPPIVEHEEHHHGPSPHHHGPPLHHHGPSLHHSIELEEPHKDFYNPHEQELEYYSGGPGLSHHFINHRQDSSEDTNEVSSAPKKPSSGRLKPTEIEAMVLKAEREAMLKARLQQERQRIHEENARLQEQLRQAMKLQDKLKQQAAVVKSKLPIPVLVPPAPNTALQTPATEIKQVYSAKIKDESKAKEKLIEKALHQAASITYDPFYSPILEKIDKILLGLGFEEEGCRERLICSMYKNPTGFSPHSNLLSAELSRDSSELQKPTTTNAAVIRFYRYVQAARDGQDKRECLRLYPTCTINTEQ